MVHELRIQDTQAYFGSQTRRDEELMEMDGWRSSGNKAIGSLPCWASASVRSSIAEEDPTGSSRPRTPERCTVTNCPGAYKRKVQVCLD